MAYDTYTKLLLHYDGTAGSQDFPDSSNSNHTMTAHGNVQVDTDTKKFGTGAGLFDGTTDYLTTPNSSDWDFGTGDFTIDFWARINTPAGNDGFVTTHDAGGAAWNIEIGGGNTIVFNKLVSGTFSVTSAAGACNSGTWRHYAIVRNGNSMQWYVDGTASGASVDVTGKSIDSRGVGLTIGSYYIHGTGWNLDGRMDELRISKGIARWTENFTPPTGPYLPIAIIRNKAYIIG